VQAEERPEANAGAGVAAGGAAKTTTAAAPLLCVVGPTASGKSALALRLAERWGAEIVSCDSAQVYRGMDVGTAKPAPAERARVAHHLLDLADPETPMDAARWAAAADAAIAAIRARGARVIVCGGTGLWLRALLEGLVPAPATDPAVRARLAARARAEGVEALHGELARRDPPAAARLAPTDRQRVLRALEHLEQAGPAAPALSALWEAHRAARAGAPPRHAAALLLLDPPRDELYARIDARVGAMLAAGLQEEVRALAERARRLGVARGALGTVLGYRQLLRHLDGTLPRDEAVRLIRRDTRRYAKRQLTWFRKVPGVRAVPPADPDAVAAEAWGPGAPV
jgi:tRNA dimethylallyltransferase